MLLRAQRMRSSAYMRAHRFKEVVRRSKDAPSEAETASGKRAARKGERKARRRRNASVGPALQGDETLVAAHDNRVDRLCELVYRAGHGCAATARGRACGSEVKMRDAEEGARVAHAQESVAWQ
jgi:hypothetical protein